MKEYFTKKNIILLSLMLIISIGIICFVYNDYFLYKTPILRITKIDNKLTEESATKEKHYTQTITGIIKNGKYKDKKITLKNYTSSSGVYDEQIHKRSELFLELDKNGENVLSITGIKRDKYLAILGILFIDLILLIAGKKGIKTLASLFVNILITAISILTFKKYYKSLSILLLYFIVAILFIICSLGITNKRSKKTLSAILSSIISIFISFGLSFLIIKLFGKTLPYWTMDYIETVYDYENYFYVSILLCGLGAIMDVSITMSSSLNELIIKNPKISTKSLIASGKEISKDITGTMINVMLYTVYVSVIPMVLIAIKNNISVASAISYYGNVELIVILTSCISIVLTIPIALYTSVFLLKRKGDGNK